MGRVFFQLQPGCVLVHHILTSLSLGHMLQPFHLIRFLAQLQEVSAINFDGMLLVPQQHCCNHHNRGDQVRQGNRVVSFLNDMLEGWKVRSSEPACQNAHTFPLCSCINCPFKWHFHSHKSCFLCDILPQLFLLGYLQRTNTRKCSSVNEELLDWQLFQTKDNIVCITCGKVTLPRLANTFQRLENESTTLIIQLILHIQKDSTFLSRG